MFERFSDSAGAYIALDSNNPSVYKQLYRAAKAKLKLRIKVSVAEMPTPKLEAVKVDSVSPDRLTLRCYAPPVNPSIENIVSADSIINNAFTIEEPSAQGERLAPLSPQQTHHELPPKSHKCSIPNLLIPKSLSEVGTETTTKPNEDATRKETDGEAPVPHIFKAREQSHTEIREMMTDRVSSGCPALNRLKLDYPHVDRLLLSADQTFPVPGTTFTICCNNCDVAIPDAHWHCGICDNGDFDLCFQCVDEGELCDDEDHWLIKRFVQDGKVINSTTETIAPKKIDKATVESEKEVPGAFNRDCKTEEFGGPLQSRTCNSCIGGEFEILISDRVADFASLQGSKLCDLHRLR